jgi:ABC-type glycerol-3-phosphate transport system substrate-binding protein
VRIPARSRAAALAAAAAVANVARSDKVADLAETVKDPAFQWSDYYPAARDSVTIDGRVRALPALIFFDPATGDVLDARPEPAPAPSG